MVRLLLLVIACVGLWSPKTVAAFDRGVSLPQVLEYDADLFDRYWRWVTAELGAPANLPAPRITVEPLPRGAKMALFFPTAGNPQRALRIAMSPRSLDRAANGERLRVIGELAHEVVHYLLLLSENGWVYSGRALRNDVHHHCDRTFQRLTRQVGAFLWDAYHSDSVVRAIDQMVRLSCWKDGQRLAAEH